VGQEELAARIVRYKELASRRFPIAISAMSPEELEQMIRFRWMVAGGKDIPFSSDSQDLYKTLYAYTKGLPRDTVKVCEEVLRDLLVKNKRYATTAEVEQIAKELNLRILAATIS
jgi:hypothetical protein